jgi:ribosome biogenesis protein BRX1
LKNHENDDKNDLETTNNEQDSSIIFPHEKLTKTVKRFRNQQRVLVLSSRGSNSRHRHLLQDIRAVLPHHKKDTKFDTKDKVSTLNEIADLKNCNTCIYLEIRRKTDCYMWISRTPNGPSARFYVENS